MARQAYWQAGETELMRLSRPKDMLRQGESNRSAPLYDRVMAGALDPALYLAGVAEDTFEGRFQMVTVHTVLVRRQLRRFGISSMKRTENLFARVLSGFDYALREGGTGDHSIARKARKLGEEFYGLALALDDALGATESLPAVEIVLVRNGIADEKAPALAKYILKAEAHLAEVPEYTLTRGQFDWPTYEE